MFNQQPLMASSVSELIALPEWAERDASRIPAFPLGERLNSCAEELTPEVFHRIADATLKDVYGYGMRIAPDYTFPMDEEPDDDIAWLTERNLMRMENYLRYQIERDAEPNKIRQDLVHLDRYLNDYLRRNFVDPEEADLESLDYFARYLLTQDPIPPFGPEFGTLTRFYGWMMEDPVVKDRTNWEGVSTSRFCRQLLKNLRMNIPYLLRLREIAVGNDSDPAEGESRSGSGRTGKIPKRATAFDRLEAWHQEQLTANRKILSRFRKDLETEPGWSDPNDRFFAERLTEIYLTETLPDQAFRSDQIPLSLSTFTRDVRKIIVQDGWSGDLHLLGETIKELMVSLVEQGVVPVDMVHEDWDPWYPSLRNMNSQADDPFPPEDWPADRSPDLYEDHLAWRDWNVGRNRLFLRAFRDDLASGGMDPDRASEHVRRVKSLMGGLLELAGRPMEDLPAGIEALLSESDEYRYEWNPDRLRTAIGSLRRFYRSMIRLGHLSPEAGDELLVFLKERTGDWVDLMKKSQSL